MENHLFRWDSSGHTLRLIIPQLTIVTDRRLARDLPGQLEAMLAAVEPGGALVQVREKDLGGAALYALTTQIVAIAKRYNAPVLVNDRLDVALAAGATGVHLPEDGMPIEQARALAGDDFAVSCSRHSVEGVREAIAAKADMIVLGPIFATPSKAAYGPPLGIEALDPFRKLDEPMLVAIGGIETAAQAAACKQAGAWGVAAIRALWTADDPGAVARALYDA